MDRIERVGCPACRPSPLSAVLGPGCDQCEGQGWVWKVPNGLGEDEVRRQIMALQFSPARLSFEGRSYVLDPDGSPRRGVPVQRTEEMT